LPPTEPPPALVLAQSASPTILSFEPAERLAVAVVMSLLLAAATDDSVQDIWQDGPTLHYVQHGTLPANVTTEERNRISHRATRYRWDSALSKLHRVLADGGSREVPPLAHRPAIVLQAHNKYGHWGIRRTYALLSPFYWWHSMLWSDSAEAVRRCAVCDRSKASYNVRPAELSPLPIQGPGYRWHVDLAGPLPPTPQGHVYVLIAVDAFTKWVEAVPIPDKSSATTADAFLFHVLSRQGACAEVVSDQGKEFSGDFEELLVNCGIDHRMTSHDHPQANGQAERMVQTIKAALRRMADEALHT
jgi:transposase InsO family protein